MIKSGLYTVIGAVYSGQEGSIESTVFLKFPSLSLETKVLSSGSGQDLDLGKKQYVSFPETVTDFWYGCQITYFIKKKKH